MNNLKNIDEELFSAFKQSDYVIGFLVGSVSSALSNPLASQRVHEALVVAEVRDISKLEAFALTYKEEILKRAKQSPVSLTEIDYEILDELYLAIEKDLKGEPFSNRISEMFSKLKAANLKALLN